MKPEFYLAKRFAFNKRSASKPTFIVMVAVIGIAVGTAALILTLSIVKGFADSIESKLIGFSTHMQIRQPDDRLFPERRTDLAMITGNSNVENAFPFLEKSFVIRSRIADGSYRSKPVIVKGITGQQRTAFLKNYLRNGTTQYESDIKELSLFAGGTLAENLHLTTGKKVLLIGLGNGSEGTKLITENKNMVDLLSSLNIEVGIIRGIYDTGLQEGFDDSVLLCDLDQLQARFDPAKISGYDANVRNLAYLPATVRSVTEKLGYPFYGYTVFERYANLFEWLKLQKNIMPLLIVTITVVAVFNIISTLLVLIIEKTREIGMLCALGLEPRKISTIFISQAFLISLIGIAAGNLTALSFSMFEQHFHFIKLPEKSYFIKYVAILIDPLDYAAVSLAVLALTLVFAFIPARIAASLKPGTALGT
jgi:lipoprotein-releasing system permease protein